MPRPEGLDEGEAHQETQMIWRGDKLFFFRHHLFLSSSASSLLVSRPKFRKICGMSCVWIATRWIVLRNAMINYHIQTEFSTVWGTTLENLGLVPN